MKRTLGLLAFIVSLVANGQQATQSFSLKEAQAYALKNSYDVQDKKLLREQAQKVILETVSAWLPQITATADYTYNAQIPLTPVPDGFIGPPDGQPDLVAFGVEHQTNASLSYNQLIFDASLFVAIQATKVYKEIKDLDIEKSEIDVEANVANRYAFVLVSEESELVAAENVKSLQDNLSEVRELYKNGFREEQDVDQIELLLSKQTAVLNNSRRTTEFSYRALKFAMGMPYDQELKLTDEIESLLMDEETERALLSSKLALDSHIDLRIVRANVRAAKLQLKNQRNTFYPSLSGFVRHTESNFGNDGFNAFDFNTFWVPGTALGLSLKWNLFQGMGRTARIQQARIDFQRAELGETTTKNNLELNYLQAKSNFANAYETYTTNKKNLELSKKIKNKTQIKFKEGISSSFDLTQSEEQYLQSQFNYLQSIIGVIQSKEDFRKILSSKNN